MWLLLHPAMFHDMFHVLPVVRTEAGSVRHMAPKDETLTPQDPQSQRCPRNCSGVLAVTFIEGAMGLLARFVLAYLGYITRGGAGVALAGCHEPTCQMLIFSYTQKQNRFDSRGEAESDLI